MWIVAIAWVYVTVMMAMAEATSPHGTILGAVITLVFYGLVPVSLGYDRIRFVRAVFPGQTLRLRYEFVTWDPGELRATATVEAFVEDELVAVGTHVVVWVPADPA